MATFTIKFTSGLTQEVDAQDVRLTGHESQWTDFYDNPNLLKLRLRSFDIDRIERD